MRSARLFARGFVIASIVLVAPGCITTKTTEVRLRDPAQVAIYRGDGTGQPVIPRGMVARATLEASKYFVPLHWQHYEIQAIREPSGLLRLHCEGCRQRSALNELAGFSGDADLTLVTPAGVILPLLFSKVSIGKSELRSSEDFCWVDQASGEYSSCDAGSRWTLAVPLDDVLEVHSHEQPLRAWGVILTVVGGLGLAAAVSVVALAAPSRAGMALGGGILGVPALTSLGFGLWSLLAGARDEYRSFGPPPTPEASSPAG